MKKVDIGLDVLKVAEKMLGYNRVERSAVIKLKDGSRMTAHLNIFFTPEGPVLLNISGVKTLQFDQGDEYRKYLEKKFELYDNDKEMYKNFCGMTEETWKVWNGEEV